MWSFWDGGFARWGGVVNTLKELYDALDATADGIKAGHRPQLHFPGHDGYEFRKSEKGTAFYSKRKITLTEEEKKPVPAEARRYRKDLNHAIKSDRASEITVSLGRTPPVLRKLGAGELPTTITRGVVRKATNGVKHVKHDVPLDVIRRLPELLHDPIRVFKSATRDDSALVWLDAKSENGDPVVAALVIHPKKGLEVTEITSVYDTLGGMKKIDSYIRRGLTLYVHTPAKHGGGVQFAGAAESRKVHDKNLSNPKNSVNKNSKPVLSPDAKLTEPASGVSLNFARRVADKLTRKIRGVEVQVVKTQAEAEALAGEKTGAKVNALYLPERKTIVLVADNLNPGNVAAKTRHELIHHALEHLISSEEYNGFIRKILDTRSSKNATVRKLWQTSICRNCCMIQLQYLDLNQSMKKLKRYGLTTPTPKASPLLP